MKYFVLNFVQKLRFVISYIFQKGFSEIQFIKNHIDNNSIIVDVGSNVGSFIQLFIKSKLEPKIYSIEPDTFLVEKQKNKFKKFENIKYFNTAIDEKNGTAQFYIRKPSSHSSLSLYHPDNKFNQVVSTVNISVETIKSFMEINNINFITLLKIDTEGLDYKILSSIKEILKKNKIKYLKIEANSDSFEEIMNFAFVNNLKFIGSSNFFYYKNKLNMMDIYFENQN